MAIVSTSGNWTPALANWPWPKVKILSHYVLGFAMADKDDVSAGIPAADDSLVLYEMYCDTSDDWQVTACQDLGLVSEIDQVEIADFGTYYVVMVYGQTGGSPYADGWERDPTAASGTSCMDALPSASLPVGASVCNFKGQMILGGVYTTDPIWTELGWNSVLWAGIGTAEFRPSENLTAGFAAVGAGDWNLSKVLNVSRVGDQVIVLGEGYGELLIPFTSENVSGFGQLPLQCSGISSSNHVAGDAQNLYFLDLEDNLQVVGTDGKVEELGYQEYMQELTRANVQFSYVGQKKMLFISDGVKCFVLNQYGLYECHQLISSAGYYRGKLCGFFINSADYEGRIQIDTYDYALRGFKLLETLEVGANYNDSSDNLIKTRVSYRSSHVGSFKNLDWTRLNPEGFGHPFCQALEFRVGVKITDYREDDDFSLSYVKSRIKLTDKRTVRGLYYAHKDASNTSGDPVE